MTEIKPALTESQEAELRRLKAFFPYRIVWGEIVKDSGQFNAFASHDKRALNQSLRAGNLVATIQ